ncbi:MAG: Bifunctional protein HldE [Phycisphaerae bacterium]|nr:Bifunctional protein HldE [Phycisphaerae bacterium]
MIGVSSELIGLAERLGGQRVLLVGDVMLDRYIYGDAERISPEAPVPVLRAVDQQVRVGGAGSVAANLLALGVEVICCGVVGDDASGAKLLELLQSQGANCSGILKVPSRPTTTKTRFIGLAQHRHRQQMLRFDEEDTTPINDKQLDYLGKVIDKVIDKVDVVCIEDYNKGLLGSGLAELVTRRARTMGKPVLVDPAPISNYERYRGTTLLTPNRLELATAVGRRMTSLEEMGLAGVELIQQLELQALVVTVDKEGAVLCQADGSFEHIPTRPRAVYDNTGAGDAVLAMLAAALAAKANLQQAVQMANIAGGLEVEKFGCVPILKEEVLADLRLEHRRQVGKMRTLEQLLSELQLRRDRGESVVFTNGCFDLLHRGHVEYLREAAELADILVIGLNTDASVQRQLKGPERPVVKEDDRAALLSALEAVDYVVFFDEDTPAKLIEAIRPNVLAKGADWANRGVVGSELVESYGGRVELITLREGYSTTALIERIRRGRHG